ncbi:MAG: AAA family ATPase [Butyrivibrio sp.]|nr:AAA family ATPase [Butyrivibrio sp.]
MFDEEIFRDCLKQYKEDFVQRFSDERYKWEAVQWFQTHWDVNAENFYQMFTDATEKTYNLLASMNNFPRGMIQVYSEQDPEAVRAMFINLFDESKDVTERVVKFQADAQELCDKLSPGKQHYQRPMAISVYLWLHNPDKYCIFKYTALRKATVYLKNDFIPKKGNPVQNIRGNIEFTEEIRKLISQDEELVRTFRSVCDEACYADSNLLTLANDLEIYISSEIADSDDNGHWIAEDYDSGITKERWKELIADEKIFDERGIEVVTRMLNYGGQATCTQLADKYGENASYYNFGSSSLAKKVAKETGCPLWIDSDGKENYWTILYVGRDATKDENGDFVCKLRDEIRQALEETDLSHVRLYSEVEKAEQVDIDSLHSNNAYNKWLNAIVVAIRELGGSAKRKEVHDKIIELYEISEEELAETHKSGAAKVLNNIDWARNYLAYEGILDAGSPSGIWTLSSVGQKIVVSDDLAGKIIAKWNKINAAKRDNKPIPEIDLEPLYEYINVKEAETKVYTKENFLSEVYMTQERYDTLRALLMKKKNLILQGAPGVGKTFAAKRLAYSIMGCEDESRIESIQFHQSYSYEDFIMGYKPSGDSFELEPGIFYDFCRRASDDKERPYFFIIDEINRGNMSKIFGELLMLIESDYREKELKLAYNKKPFYVPKNIYLIGMMNTADRSLAMIDYALRRRFSFFTMEPGFSSEGFQKYQKSFENDVFDALIERIRELNMDITKDGSLGSGFCIGHSYFCGQTEMTEEWMQSVVEYDILPMLEEYWFDEPAKLQKWQNILRGVFND